MFLIRLDKNIFKLIFSYLGLKEKQKIRAVSRLFNNTINSMMGKSAFDIRSEYHQLHQKKIKIQNQLKIQEKIWKSLHRIEHDVQFSDWFWSNAINAMNNKIRNGEYDNITIPRPPDINFDDVMCNVSNFSVKFIYSKRILSLIFQFYAELPSYNGTYTISCNMNLISKKYWWSGWDNVTIWDFINKGTDDSQYLLCCCASNQNVQHILELILYETFFDVIIPAFRNMGHDIPNFHSFSPLKVDNHTHLIRCGHE